MIMYYNNSIGDNTKMNPRPTIQNKPQTQVAVKATEPEKKFELATQSEYAGVEFTGLETVQAEDLKIPQLVLLQGGSKMVKEELIPGIKAGVIWNSVTNEVYDVKAHPLELIPLSFKKVFQFFEVVINEETGKEEEKFAFEDEVLPLETHHVPQTAYAMSPEGHRIYEVFRFLVLHDFSPAIISFKKSKLKIGKQWLSMMKFKGPDVPAFAYKYLISNKIETFNNNTYHNISVMPGPKVEMESGEFECIYNLAKSLKGAIDKAPIVVENE